MRPLGRGGYYAETDLPALCRLPREAINSDIAVAMTALAYLNLRIEEMRAHSSLTGFDEEDLLMFEQRLSFLLDWQNSHDQEAAFKRIVSLLEIPEVPIGHFNAGQQRGKPKRLFP